MTNPAPPASLEERAINAARHASNGPFLLELAAEIARLRGEVERLTKRCEEWGREYDAAITKHAGEIVERGQLIVALEAQLSTARASMKEKCAAKARGRGALLKHIAESQSDRDARMGLGSSSAPNEPTSNAISGKDT